MCLLFYILINYITIDNLMLLGAGLRIHNEFCTAPYIYVLVVVVVNIVICS